MRNDSQRKFQCEIGTRGDIQRSNPSILTVYYLNQPLLGETESAAYKGQSVTFTCIKPDGDPIPHITWYKDEQTVNTNNSSRYEITNINSTESVLKIKLATEEDGGNYTCKAESDQFKGEDAKTSVGKQLSIYNVFVTFQSEDVLATCTEEDEPKPSSVMIIQNGEVIKQGKNTVTLGTNDKICQSSIPWHTETEKELNDTAICLLENYCIADLYPMGTAIATTATILCCVLTFMITRCIYVRRIKEISSRHQNAPYQGGHSKSAAVPNQSATAGVGVSNMSHKERSRTIIQKEVGEIQDQSNQYQSMAADDEIDDEGYVRPTCSAKLGKREVIEIKCQNPQYKGLSSDDIGDDSASKLEAMRRGIEMERQHSQNKGLVSASPDVLYEEICDSGVTSTFKIGKVSESYYCKQFND
ncbi:uncharacterized protein [Antedon mediterranea]|uniref:uncharacterized protein n=1 Tax=Antedon mediterranea TaxID=105859 RepID=UPI003AF8049B